MSVIITLRLRFCVIVEDTHFVHKQHFKMEDKLFTSLEMLMS